MNARTLTAKYEVDDCSLEMIVHLPPEYPLKLVSVEGGRRTGVSEAQWRSWLLSAQMIMASPSGSLLDAVLMWKQNIEKRFSGVEPCAICYATISGDDATLPAKTCRTCAQKFHNGCLVILFFPYLQNVHVILTNRKTQFKWFKSSGSSTCPLCRNLF